MREVRVLAGWYKVGRVGSVKMWLAEHRQWWLMQLRCRIGRHNPPTYIHFHERGNIYIGGRCTNCSKPGMFVVAKVAGPRGPYPSQRSKVGS